jgi:hypothetical protein
MPAFRGPDGKVVYVPEDEADRYRAGGDYQEVGRAEAGAAQNRIAPTDNGVLGSIGATVSAGLSGATLGASDWLLKGVLNKGQFEQLAQDRADNPILAGTAQAAGMVIPALVSGGTATPAGALGRLAGEGIEAGRATGGALGVAQQLGAAGAEGAIANAGIYMSDVALGDRNLTAEGINGALGTGLLFGAAGIPVAHGIEAGTIAARRMFARYAEGGTQAAEAATAAWTEQAQKHLEGFDQAAELAKAKLAETQTAREAANLQRLRAGSEMADARAFTPPSEFPGGPAAPASPAGAATEAAGPAAAAAPEPPEVAMARALRDRAKGLGGEPITPGELPPGAPGFRRDFVIPGERPPAAPNALEQLAQQPGVTTQGPATLARTRGLVGPPVTADEAELGARLGEYQAARRSFDELHAQVDPDLDAILRGVQPGDVQRMPVPIGEFGAPGAGGFKSQGELARLASGTGREEGAQAASLASADATGTGGPRALRSQGTPPARSLGEVASEQAPVPIEQPSTAVGKRPAGAMETPTGFDIHGSTEAGPVFDKNPTVRSGVPGFADLERETYRKNAYVLRPSELDGPKLRGITSGEDMVADARTAKVREAWGKGESTPALEIDVDPKGNYFVADGNHRLLAAAADGDRPVLARFRPVEAEVGNMDRIGDDLRRALGRGEESTSSIETAHPGIAKEYSPDTGTRLNSEGALGFNGDAPLVEWAHKSGFAPEGAGPVHTTPTGFSYKPTITDPDSALSKYIQHPSEFNIDARAGRLTDDIKRLDAEIGARRMPETITTFRGVRSGPLTAASEGEVVNEAGFMSSSPTERRAKNFATGAAKPGETTPTIVEFDIPKGTQAHWVSDFEGEILLGRGHKLEIVSVGFKEIRGKNVRMVRARLIEPSSTIPATDTLTGQLRGMESKLGAGEDLVAMGEPARDAYRAAKAERTSEAAAHFRGKAIAAREARAGAVAAGETPNPFHEPAAGGAGSEMDQFFRNLNTPKTRDAYVAANIGRAMREEGSHAAALAKVEREWADHAGTATAAAPPATWREFQASKMAEYMKSEGGHAGAMKRLGQEWRARGEHPLDVKRLEMAHDAALERAATAADPAERAAAAQEAQVIEKQITQVGARPGAVEDIAALAPAVTRVEKAAAALTEALGDAAPAAAKEHAAAFRAAEDEASRKTVARIGQAADDAAAGRAAAQSRDPLAPPARPAEDLLLGPSQKQQRIAAAQKSQREAGAAYAKARVAEAEAQIGAKQAAGAAADARAKLGPPPETVGAAPRGRGIGGRVIAGAHAVGYAAELGSDLGIPGVPRPHDIPVIGPLLSAYLKYRALRAAAGRFMGRVPATAETQAAALAARTRDGIARAVDRSLGLVESNVNTVRAALTVGTLKATDALSKRLVDDGAPDAPAKASVSEQAAVRMREVAAVAANPALIHDAIRAQGRALTDPDLIDALSTHLVTMFQRLSEVAPKGPPPNPFTGKTWTPSPAEAIRFGQQVAIARDPQVAFQMLEAGTLTPTGADTLRACYQLLFRDGQQRVIQRATDLKNPPDYQQLIRLGRLFDLPLHPSQDPANAAVLAEAHTQAAKPAPAAGSGGPPTPSTAGPTTLSNLYQPSGERAQR